MYQGEDETNNVGKKSEVEYNYREGTRIEGRSSRIKDLL